MKIERWKQKLRGMESKTSKRGQDSAEKKDGLYKPCVQRQEGV